MSNRTREINKITTTIISISIKLIVYALIVLLLYEAVAKGYAFGHEVFYAEAAEAPPGKDVLVQIGDNETVSEAAKYLARKGIIKSEFAFIFQSKFYDYDMIYPGTYTLNTSMTSKEILQQLNEKPETGEDAQSAMSGKAKAQDTPSKASAEGAGSPQGRSMPEGNGGAAREGMARGDASQGDTARSGDESQGISPQEEAQDSSANQESYAGEDQEMEGGWIEDAIEE